jgi:pyruvate/oxaloacetate carboxyltransferase
MRAEHLRELARKCATRAASAKDALTKASFEQEGKHYLRLAEQAEKRGEKPASPIAFKAGAARKNRKP